MKAPTITMQREKSMVSIKNGKLTVPANKVFNPKTCKWLSKFSKKQDLSRITTTKSMHIFTQPNQ